jgi:hypothetical protein
MERSNHIIQQLVPGGNSPSDVPLLTLQGLVDLMDALHDDLMAQEGLVPLFSASLRDELLGVLGHDR